MAKIVSPSCFDLFSYCFSGHTVWLGPLHHRDFGHLLDLAPWKPLHAAFAPLPVTPVISTGPFLHTSIMPCPSKRQASSISSRPTRTRQTPPRYKKSASPSASPSDDSSADEQTAGPLQPTPAPGTDWDATLEARIRALESQLRAATEPPAMGGGTDEPESFEQPPPADHVSRPPKRSRHSQKRRKKSSPPKSWRRNPSSASS